MYLQDRESFIPKKALRCIRGEIPIILSEIDLDDHQKRKLEKEIIRYLKSIIDSYSGKYPIVPTKYLAASLAFESDFINDSYVIPLKEALDSMNKVEENYGDSSQYHNPEITEDYLRVSNKYHYMQSLSHGLRALSVALEVISGK